MSHLSNEDLVLVYYGEPESAGLQEHLRACDVCQAELGRLGTLLDQVQPEAVAAPPDDYEAQVWSRLQWRLRAEKRDTRRPVLGWTMAAAAALALAFFGGLLWNRRPAPAPQPVASGGPAAAAATAQTQRDRILLVVVGDHFDQSERILIELTNLDADGEVDITSERERAETLLASNRIYRRSALDRGEEGVATLLDELEPVLLQIARSDAQVSAEELRSMQKRVEAKGLVFKIRVARADVRATPPAAATLNQGSI